MSVVVVGLILNIVSGYLKEGIDKLFTVFTNRASRASTRRAEARKALIARVRNDPVLRHQFRIRRLRDAYLAATMMPVAIVELIISIGQPFHGTGGFFQPPSDAMTVFTVLTGVLFLSAGQGFSSSCFMKTVVLIRAEGPDPATVAKAPTSDVEVAARRP
ncbi:hypothetical protein [Paraburkholderia sp. RCC_158]|uniref:hypothetical protein n=1 Tax=Paraburkholderia sp. RCC_158 TaxID=3239220 RepID=UPI0035265CB7